MTKKWIPVIALLLLSAVGLAAWWLLRVPKPELAVKRIDIELPVDDLAVVAVRLEMVNPLSIPLGCLKADFRLASGGRTVLEGTLQMAQEVASGQRKELVVPIRVHLDRLRQLREEARRQQSAVEISGRLHLRGGSQSLVLPFTRTWDIPETGPSIGLRVSRCELKLVSDRQLQVDLALQVTNPTTHRLENLVVAYRVGQPGGQLATGSVSLAQPIEPGGAGEVAVPALVDLAGVKELVSRLAEAGAAITVEGQLQARVDGKESAFPFTVTKMLPARGGSESLAVRGVKVTRFCAEAVDLEAELALARPLPAPVRQATASFRVSRHGLAIIEGQAQVEAPRAGTTIVRLPLTLRAADLQQLKSESRGRSVLLEIAGMIRVELENRFLELPFTFEKEVMLPDKPFTVSLKQLRIQKLRLRGSSYHLLLEVTNRTPLDIRDVRMDGTITIEDDLVIQVLNERLSLPPGLAAVVELEVDAHRFAVLRNLPTLVRLKRARGGCQLQLRGRSADGAEVTADEQSRGELAVEERG